MAIHALLASETPFIDLAAGAPAEMLSNTLGIAKGLFLFFLAIALAVEAFGKPPTAAKDYGACVWRAVIVLTLLLWYPIVFGSVLNMITDVARRVTPDNALSTFSQQIQQAQLAAAEADATDLVESTAAAEEGAKASGVPAPKAGLAGRVIGGSLFDGLMALIITLGQIIHRVLRILSTLLVTMFYVLGPLALVASIPSISGIGTRWFGYLVTVASWPIFSGIFLALAVSLGVHRAYGAGTIGSLSAALVALLTALATPMVANTVIGQSASAFAAHGARSASSIAARGRDLVAPTAAALSRAFGGSGNSTDAAGSSAEKSTGGASGAKPPANAPGRSP